MHSPKIFLVPTARLCRSCGYSKNNRVPFRGLFLCPQEQREIIFVAPKLNAKMLITQLFGGFKKEVPPQGNEGNLAIPTAAAEPCCGLQKDFRAMFFGCITFSKKVE